MLFGISPTSETTERLSVKLVVVFLSLVNEDFLPTPRQNEG